jgi:hypothetical protein
MKNSFLILAFLVFGYAQAQENIVLNFPEDGDTIYTYNPMLTWSLLGGVPVNNSREYYRITVVELQKNQDAASGVLMNTPLVRMDHLTQLQFLYPYDAPILKAGKHYGWQIHKIVNQVIVDRSEAYEFIIPLDIVPSSQYYKMKVKSDGNIYLADKTKLKFEFVENHQANELKFSVFDEKNKEISGRIGRDKEEQRKNLPELKHIGSNFYEVELGAAAKPGIYKLVVVDALKKKYELKYRVQ